MNEEFKFNYNGNYPKQIPYKNVYLRDDLVDGLTYGDITFDSRNMKSGEVVSVFQDGYYRYDTLSSVEAFTIEGGQNVEYSRDMIDYDMTEYINNIMDTTSTKLLLMIDDLIDEGMIEDVEIKFKMKRSGGEDYVYDPPIKMTIPSNTRECECPSNISNHLYLEKLLNGEIKVEDIHDLNGVKLNRMTIKLSNGSYLDKNGLVALENLDKQTQFSFLKGATLIPKPSRS